MPRTRTRSHGSRQKKTRHLPTRRRNSPGRSFRDSHRRGPSRHNVPGPHRSVPGQRGQDAPDRAPRRDGGLRGGSQPKPPPDFLQGDIVARFRTGQIQLGRGLGIDDLLLTQFRQKGNGYLHLTVRKGIYERLKAATIAGHASIITSRAASHFQPEPQSAWTPDPCRQSAGERCGRYRSKHDERVTKGIEEPRGNVSSVPGADVARAQDAVLAGIRLQTARSGSVARDSICQMTSRP